MRRLLVVGLVSLDRVDGGLPRLGGAPWYAAQAVRALGRPAALATKVAPEDLRRLVALGVPVLARPAERTIRFGIENDGDGRRMSLEEPGDTWTTADADGWLAEALAGAEWVHAGALTRADFPAETLEALRRRSRLSFDGQGLVRPAEPGPLQLDAEHDPEVLRHVDVLKLSADELDALGLDLGERSLASLGVPEVVVTLGRGGSVVYADGLAEHVRADPVSGVDATGAGDAFMTAYLLYRSARHSPPSAARLATSVVRALLPSWRRAR